MIGSAVSRFAFQAGLAAFLGLASLPAVPQQGADDPDLIEQSIARLGALDKITARITEIDVAVGETVRFGTLAITLDYCRSRAPIETPETFAFLKIADVGLTDKALPKAVFEGWMLASSPALNPLEHPVYDVWVTECRTVAPEAVSESR